MQPRGWLQAPKLLYFLHALVWQLEQPLPTMDTLSRGVAATTVGACHHSWCQNALSAPWDCTPAGTLESTAHPQSHSGVLLMENGQTLLGDLGELGLIPVSTCRKLYV